MPNPKTYRWSFVSLFLFQFAEHLFDLDLPVVVGVRIQQYPPTAFLNPKRHGGEGWIPPPLCNIL